MSVEGLFVHGGDLWQLKHYHHALSHPILHKSHNVTVLLYHIVLSAKYRRTVFDDHVDDALKMVCLEIQDRYQMKFLEIGADKDHVHLLIQSIPTYSVIKIVAIIK